MQTNPEDLEKLLLKKKNNNGFFPTIDKIPNKESIRFVVQPPVKYMDMSMYPKNLNEVNNSCFIKFLLGGVMSAGMGAVFGFFMGSLSQMSSPMMNGATIQNPAVKPSVLKEFKRSMRFTYLKGKSSARNLALFGAAYTALECVTERIVGKKAVWTNAIAGCGAGLAFGIKNGPMSACLSCLGFAAFGVVIDMFMF